MATFVQESLPSMLEEQNLLCTNNSVRQALKRGRMGSKLY